MASAPESVKQFDDNDELRPAFNKSSDFELRVCETEAVYWSRKSRGGAVW
jgi:hypothetical protein